MTISEQLVPAPQGEVFVQDHEGQGIPVVLMHGFPDHHRIYDRLTERLAPRRVVAFDFLGYGRSGRGSGIGYTYVDHASQIAAVLDALDIRNAALVGHDASGPEAVRFAFDHPDRVSHLVLLNTVLGHRPGLIMPEMTRLFAEPTLKALADDLMADEEKRTWMLNRWGEQWQLDSADPEGLVWSSILPQFFGGADQPDALAAIRGWCAALLPALDEQEQLVQSGELKSIRAPVSVIFGARDRYLTPTLAREIADVFGRADLHVIDDAGHYPQHDRPDLVARLIATRLG